MTAARERKHHLPEVGISAEGAEAVRTIVADVVERLPIGVLVATSILDVVYANGEAERLTYPDPVRLGQPLRDVWPAFSLRAYARRLLDDGFAPAERVRPDDHTSVTVSGIRARDRGTVAILLDDVSAKERSLHAEREFVANAAHELLTPLTGIVGAAHVLEAGAKEVPEDRDRFIGHIARECDRLAGMARALLVLARAQSGTQAPRREVVPLCELLGEIVAIATAEAEVRSSVDCAGDLTVYVDRDLFVQALTNLVLNSARHGGGTLRLAATRSSENSICIDVVNDVADERSAPIEKRFVSGADADGGGGFGLGLSIARQSLEALGGTLSLASGNGDGFRARVEVLSREPS